ncbi:hypothetical protein BV925_23045 [Pectobacterium odoriferum]|nr:hypothetical protein BV925_23045 [Pectobacterium odoriferum]
MPSAAPARPLHARPNCHTTQDTHELWGNLQALSIAPFDEHAAASWLNRFPGGLNMESAR